MKNITHEFIKIIFEISRRELSEESKEQAKKCLLDYLGVLVAGSHENHEKIENMMLDSNGSCSLVGFDIKTTINNAVMINAYNSHKLELDDGHRIGMLHLAAPIFSGLLCVAEQYGCTMDDLYIGAVAGYEAAIRLAESIQPYHKLKGFHATGTCGTVGCALGIAAMLHYSIEEMLNVLSAAATSAAGLLEVITGDSEQKPYNIANAASAGVNASMFGKYFKGPEDIIGGKRGFLANFNQEYNEEKLLEGVYGKKILGIYMKPYAACRHCHAPIEAALNIGKNKELQSEEILEVTVDTYSLAVYGHEHTEVGSVNSAKMSIPYSVAVALKYHAAGLEMYTQDYVCDKEIQALTRKVITRENEVFSSFLPEKRVAKVTVKYVDGTEECYQCDYPKGEPENPITWQELTEKFVSLVEIAKIKKQRAEEIIEFVDKQVECKIGELLKLLIV